MTERASYPPAWDEVVTCKLCGHVSRAQWKRSGYRPGTWLCLSRRACFRRQRRRDYAAMWRAFRAGGAWPSIGRTG